MLGGKAIFITSVFIFIFFSLIPKLRNIFKTSEDPLGYSTKKFFSKEELEFLKKAYYTSIRLQILDVVSTRVNLMRSVSYLL